MATQNKIPLLLLVSACALANMRLCARHDKIESLRLSIPAPTSPNTCKNDCSELATFLRPVVINPEGLQDFFERTYNHERYGSEFLPACFAHLNDFFDCIPNIKLPLHYTTSVLSLFHQKLKETLWVNPFAFETALDALTKNISPMFDQERNIKECAKPVIFEALRDEFATLKTDPEKFIDILATRLAEKLNSEEEKQTYELQQLTLRFIESALDKMVWNPHDELATWQSCCRLGEKLCSWGKTTHCSTDTINAFCWSLTTRYAHFLSTVGALLSINTIKQIEHDCSLASALPAFLALPEHEQPLTSKRDFILRALKAATLKNLAYQEGVIVE